MRTHTQNANLEFDGRERGSHRHTSRPLKRVRRKRIQLGSASAWTLPSSGSVTLPFLPHTRRQVGRQGSPRHELSNTELHREVAESPILDGSGGRRPLELAKTCDPDNFSTKMRSTVSTFQATSAQCSHNDILAQFRQQLPAGLREFLQSEGSANRKDSPGRCFANWALSGPVHSVRFAQWVPGNEVNISNWNLIESI